MHEKQGSPELPEARTVSERPSVRSTMARPFRWVGRLIWRKAVLLGLIIALVASAAIGGIGYAIWKHCYWLPQESRLAVDHFVTPLNPESVRSSSGEVLNEGDECWVLHGRKGHLVAANDEYELVLVRYTALPDDTGKALKKKLVWYRQSVSFETRLSPVHCPTGTLFLLREDDWRDMPDEYDEVRKGIEAYNRKQERLERMIERAVGQD